MSNVVHLNGTDAREATQQLRQTVARLTPRPLRTESEKFIEANEETYELLNYLIYHKFERKFSCLAGQSIKIIHNKKPKTSKGRTILGSVKLFSEAEGFLHGYAAQITLDLDYWQEHPSKREALLFHELCHIETDDDGDLITVGHDIEEFYDVLRHYGDWKNEGRVVTEQLRLFTLSGLDEIAADLDARSQSLAPDEVEG